jgi:hypothetical protein
MRENRTSGTVCGVSGNRHSYHDGYAERGEYVLKIIDGWGGTDNAMPVARS